MSEVQKVLEKLCKWRLVFAGWQLGTRGKGDPECDAVRDHRELSILLRAELSAVTNLLIEKGVFSLQEYHAQLEREADLLDKAYERKFPGFRTEAFGVVMDARAKETMKGWRP